MEEAYNNWNELKKSISTKKQKLNHFPREGQVWISILGKNLGSEQDGSGNAFSRPVLVLKKFNNNIFWCVPLSTKQKSLDFYYNFTDPTGNNVSLILAQMRLLSIKRLVRDIYNIPDEFLVDIKEKIKTFL